MEVEANRENFSPESSRVSESGGMQVDASAVTEAPTGKRHKLPLPTRLFQLNLLVIAAVAWVANYTHFTQFGFYEDDWFSSTFPYWWKGWPDVFRSIWAAWKSGAQGRPLGMIPLDCLNYIGAIYSSIGLLYVISYVIVCVDSLMLYAVLSRRFRHPYPLLATLLFVLSPFTTLRQHLNIQYNEFSLAYVFLFSAMLLYLSGRRKISYLVAAMTLMCLESVFFLFLAAPLLDRKRLTWKDWRRVAVHGAICFVITIVYFLLRKLAGESRVMAVNLGPAGIAAESAKFSVWYFFHSFGLYIHGIYLGWRDARLEAYLYCVLVFLPLLFWLFRGARARRFFEALGAVSDRGRNRWFGRAILVSSVFLWSGYTVSYFHLGQSLVMPYNDRDTRINAAASVGSSMFMAAVLLWLIVETRKRRISWAGYGISAAFLSSLFLYSFVVQDDYVKNWLDQKNLVTQVVMLTPDVDPDSTFIIEMDPLIPDALLPGKVRQPAMGDQHHGLEWIIDIFLGWRAPNRTVVAHSDDWKRYLKIGKDGKVYWTHASFPGAWGHPTDQPMTSGKIIYIKKTSTTGYQRMSDPLMVGGKQIIQILGPPPYTGSRWPSLVNSRLFPMIVPEFAIERSLVPFAFPRDPRVPVAERVSPIGGNGKAQRFTLTVSDENGANDIVEVFFMVHANADYHGACEVSFNLPARMFKMPNAKDYTWTSYAILGQGSVANNHCSVDVASADLRISGTSLQVEFPVSFKDGYSGPQNIYANISDSANLSTGWRLLGTWNVR
jgi:hypothetical protein